MFIVYKVWGCWATCWRDLSKERFESESLSPKIVETVSVLFVDIDADNATLASRDDVDVPLELTSISVTGVKIFADKNR